MMGALGCKPWPCFLVAVRPGAMGAHVPGTSNRPHRPEFRVHPPVLRPPSWSNADPVSPGASSGHADTGIDSVHGIYRSLVLREAEYAGSPPAHKVARILFHERVIVGSDADGPHFAFSRRMSSPGERVANDANNRRRCGCTHRRGRPMWDSSRPVPHHPSRGTNGFWIHRAPEPTSARTLGSMSTSQVTP